MINRNTLLAWILLMGLMLFWTNYKQKQTLATMKAKKEQQRIDSLANVAKNGGKALNAAEANSGVANGSSNPGAVGTAGAASAQLSPAGASAASNTPMSPKDSAAARAAQALVVAERHITVETKKFIVRLDNQGARVEGLTLKDMAGHKPLNANIIPDNHGGALTLTIDNQDLSKTLWQVEGNDSVFAVEKNPITITFKTTLPGTQKTIKREFTFFPDDNKFTQHLESSDLINSYEIDWKAGLGETEKIQHAKGFGLMNTFFSEVAMDNGSNVNRVSFLGRKTFNAESGVIRWVGLRRKYVAAMLNFNKETTNKVVANGYLANGEEDKSYPKDYELQVVGSNYDEKDLDFDFVILPLAYDQLIAYHQNYEKIIFSGWEQLFRADIWYVALCGFVLHTLKFFHSIIPNYGIAIILLTLLVRLITFPLTIAQTKQGVKMQQHMPAIQKIREKHKGNAQKANLEIMEYYKREGVNPLSGVMGCFPVFLQMPIFISLFNVLGRAVELKGAPFFGWIHDLALPDVVMDSFQVPYVFPVGLTILPFFMAITMFFQMKLSIKDPNQKAMVWLMPVMMFLFSCAFPSGLVLYWTVSNLFTIGQTYFYTNKLKGSPNAVLVSKTGPGGNGNSKTSKSKG